MLRFTLRYFVLLLVVLLTYSLPVPAQDVRYSKIIPGDTTHDKNVLNRLIFLGWQNNPDNHQHLNSAQAARFNVKRSDFSWLNQVVVSANVNQYSVGSAKNYAAFPAFYPLYNLQVAIPLGLFFTASNESRQAKALFRESLDNVNSAKMDTRLRVTTAWEELKMFHRQLTVQQQLNENAYTDFLANEKKFKDGKINLKEYNLAMTRYSELLLLKISLDRNVQVSKANLERLIGVSLDEVISITALDKE